MKSWTLALACAWITLSACDDGEKDSEETGDPSVDCAALDVRSCNGAPTCAIIYGRPLNTDGAEPCVDFSSDLIPLGCMRDGDGCGDAETLGERDGECSHWFSNTCLPSTFSVCDEPTSADECTSE